MKSFSIFLLLLLTSIVIQSQSLVNKKLINSDEQLRYSILTLCDDPELKQSFESQFQNQLKNKPCNFIFTTEQETEPDIIVSIAQPQNKPIVANAMISTIANHSIMLRGDIETIGNELSDTIYNYYYSGSAPLHSTVFKHGEGGYLIFRIPSIITTSKGTTVAFAEARANHKDCAENDIVAKISKDGGKTWGELLVIAQAGENSLNNPTAVYVEELGRILLMFQEYKAKLDEGSARTGIEGDGVTKTYIIHSDDQGNTWSAMKDITKQIKIPEAIGYCTGPGIGIRVLSGDHKGRILIPTNVSGSANGWYNYLCYSDDLGETWNILDGQSSYGTNESQVVQLNDNDFLINARCHKFRRDLDNSPEGWNAWNFPELTKCRGFIPVTMTKNDTSWGRTIVREDLIDPLCQGSIIRTTGLQNNEKSRVLVSNPASTLVVAHQNRIYKTTPPMRINGVARISYDDAKTFSYSKRIHGDRYTDFFYSVLTNLGDGRVGCIFETMEGLKFAAFDIEWLTSGTDKGK